MIHTHERFVTLRRVRYAMRMTESRWASHTSMHFCWEEDACLRMRDGNNW